MVCLRDLRRRSHDAWNATAVREIMTPTERLTTVSPQDDAFDALTLLGQRNLNQIPVLDDGRLVGMIRREDVLNWLSVRGTPDQSQTAAT